MGQSFCLSPQPLLNLIKALLTHHNKADRPLGAFAFQFLLQKQWEAGFRIEMPKSVVQAPYLQGNNADFVNHDPYGNF